MKQNKLALFLIIIGILWTSYKYIFKNEELIIEKNRIDNTLQNQVSYLKKDVDTYDMVLEIPKINLKKGVYSKYDIRNTIKKNVMIHEKSDYPNQENSNLILMAHSGNSDIAYFNDLVKLDTDSLIKVYYQNVKYTYKLDHYYDVDKFMPTKIIRDKTKNTITLVTCNQKDKTKQTIYIGYLIDKI